VLLIDLALMPFPTAVLAQAFRDGEGQRTAVVVHGISFKIAAMLFNVIWLHARRGHLLTANIAPTGVPAITGRFRLALIWFATGTLLGAIIPLLGVAVIAAFILYYWLPIAGELTGANDTATPTPADHCG
jgi:uncharacterized membrane protein